MIFVTRLDGNEMLVNQDLIAMAEATPDTVLTFTTGSKLMVKEKLPELAERIVAYERRVHAEGVPGVSHG
ncbi:MAG: flagellar FlbD family protein [Myxococcaceae bacterium]|nr:flagellar FlbD family protein [Myxococcaceae bacterium]